MDAVTPRWFYLMRRAYLAGAAWIRARGARRCCWPCGLRHARPMSTCTSPDDVAPAPSRARPEQRQQHTGLRLGRDPDGEFAVNGAYIYGRTTDTFTIGRAGPRRHGRRPELITGSSRMRWRPTTVHLLDGNRGRHGFDRTCARRRHGVRPDVHLQPRQRRRHHGRHQHMYWTNGGNQRRTNAAMGHADLRRHDRQPGLRPGSRPATATTTRSPWTPSAVRRTTRHRRRSRLDQPRGPRRRRHRLDFVAPLRAPFGAVDAAHSTRERPGGSGRNHRDPRSGGRTSTAARRTPSPSSTGWDPSTAAPYRWPSTRCPPRAPAPTRRSPARPGRTGCAGRTTTT